MSDTPPPEAAARAAAEAAAAAPPPEAPAEPEEIEDLPEDTDTFDRSYVEKLRSEAAKWRTRTREFESNFEGYSDAERSEFLRLASMLNDPNKQSDALEQFRGVTNRLANQLGQEAFPVQEETPEPTADAAPAALTAEDVSRLVEERLAAAEQQQQQKSEVEAAFAEAESLAPGYSDPAAKAHLFAVAQNRNVSLQAAHEIIQGELQEAIDAAVAEHMEALRTGKHAPKLPAADGTNVLDQGPPKTLEEARARAEQRLRAAGYQ